MSECKGCGAEIKWIRTSKGKSMPVDPELIDGNDSSTLVTESGQVFSNQDGTSGITGYRPHWASCPVAHKF